MSSLESTATLPASAEVSAAQDTAAQLSGEVARALVVSAVALVVDYGLMVALHELAGIYHLLAAAAGFGVGLTTNYLLSVTWVFRSRSVASPWLEFSIFAAIGVAGLALTVGIMYLGTDLLGGPYWLVRVVAVGLVFAWNFGARKLALFRAEKAT
jgi:putative flippase GtrA